MENEQEKEITVYEPLRLTKGRADPLTTDCRWLQLRGNHQQCVTEPEVLHQYT
jgi:hypothetical protein